MLTGTVSELCPCGKTDTVKLFEQRVRLTLEGKSLLIKQIALDFFKPTRNGEKEIAILPSLPSSEASTAVVAQLYRQRRSVENLFLTVIENYGCEIQTWEYPKAALFSFCLAWVTYNILPTVLQCTKSVHELSKIEASLYDYYTNLL